MTEQATPFLKAAGATIILFLSINVLGFLFQLLKRTHTEELDFRFKLGTIYVNDVATGLVWGEMITSIVLGMIFVSATLAFRARNTA